MEEYESLNITLTVAEVYALQGIFLDMAGTVKQTCKCYNVDSRDLYRKLDAVTDAWVKAKYQEGGRTA